MRNNSVDWLSLVGVPCDLAGGSFRRSWEFHTAFASFLRARFSLCFKGSAQAQSQVLVYSIGAIDLCPISRVHLSTLKIGSKSFSKSYEGNGLGHEICYLK